MDDVQCGGTEATLQECQFNGWGLNNCAHNEDVGVICLNGKEFDWMICISNLLILSQIQRREFG